MVKTYTADLIRRERADGSVEYEVKYASDPEEQLEKARFCAAMAQDQATRVLNAAREAADEYRAKAEVEEEVARALQAYIDGGASR